MTVRTIGWVVVVMLGLGIHLWLYPYVNPVAAMRMRVSHQDARQLATQFLTRESVLPPAGSEQVAGFEVDEKAKAYLEQTLGLRAANRVMQDEGFAFRWAVRWFRAGSPEQYHVTLDPTGRVLGYAFEQPDDAGAPASLHPEATARAYLLRVAEVDLDAYRLVQQSKNPLKARTDYRYTWERSDARLGAATQRVTVTVAGDRVIAYARGLHVPESFVHRYNSEQEKGNLLAQIAFFGFLIFGLAGIAFLVMGMIRRTLDVRIALLPTIAVAAITLVNDLNLLPLYFTQFDPSETTSTFWMSVSQSLLLEVLLMACGIALLVIAAEWIYRRAFPEHPSLRYWFSWKGLASPAGRQRLWIGYALLLAHLGFVSFFYYVVEHYFGGWSPASVAYDDLFNTSVPWAYALLIGIEAAVMEEFTFRVLAISWLRRLVKYDWLAILIPAMIWGFAHCSYPNKPFFIRGIELTIWGVLWGIIFVRFGPLPTLLAHAGFNALIMGEAFLGSVAWGARGNFAVVLFVLLLPLLLTFVLRSTSTDEAPELNAAYDDALDIASGKGPIPTPLPEDDPPYRRIPVGYLLAGIGVLILGVGIGAGVRQSDPDPEYAWNSPQPPPLVENVLDRGQAIAHAQKALRTRRARTTGWVMSASLGRTSVPDIDEAYLHRYLLPVDIEELIPRITSPQSTWQVRWQKPQSREHWTVRLFLNGKVWDIVHGVPEERGAPEMPQETARRLAAAALRARSLPLDTFRLTGTDAERLPNRTRYHFTWEPRDLEVGAARFLTIVTVDAGAVQGIEQTIKAPDSFHFKVSKSSFLGTLGNILVVFTLLALIGYALLLDFRAVARFTLPWRWGVRVAASIVALVAALSVLTVPAHWINLPATLSPLAFSIVLAVSVLSGLALLGTLLAVSLPLAAVQWYQAFPESAGPRYWWAVLTRPLQHGAAWHEAFLAQGLIGGVVLIAAGVVHLSEVGAASFRQSTADIPTWLSQIALPPGATHPTAFLDFTAPPLVVVLSAVIAGLGALYGWLLLLAVAKRIFRHPLLAFSALYVLGLFAVMSPTMEAIEYLAYTASFIVLALLGWMLYRMIIRRNPLALGLAVTQGLLLIGIVQLVQCRAYWGAAGIIGGCVLLLWGWAFFAYLIDLASASDAPARVPAGTAPTLDTPPLTYTPHVTTATPVPDLATALAVFQPPRVETPPVLEEVATEITTSGDTEIPATPEVDQRPE